MSPRDASDDSGLPGMPVSEQNAAARYVELAEAQSREAASQVDCRRDVAYGPHPAQRLDIYAPRERPAGRMPVLVMVHGGRWVRSGKQWMGAFAPAVTRFPALLVAPTLRIAPKFRMPVLPEDVAAALAWVHGHIAELGGDPERLYLGGHSSGGHLAALVTLCHDYTAAHGLPADMIKGCFPLCGTYDLDFAERSPGSEGAAIMDSVLERWEDAPRYSPLQYVRGNTTPFYLVYGSQDFPRVMDSGARLAAAMAEQPGRSVLEVYEGQGHFDVALQACRAESRWMQVVREWVQHPESANQTPD